MGRCCKRGRGRAGFGSSSTDAIGSHSRNPSAGGFRGLARITRPRAALLRYAYWQRYLGRTPDFADRTRASRRMIAGGGRATLRESPSPRNSRWRTCSYRRHVAREELSACGRRRSRLRDRGRSDHGPGPVHAALISRSLAESAWPGQDPIGELVNFAGMDGDLTPLRIVGIVGDVRNRLESPARNTLYAYYRQRPGGHLAAFSIALKARDPAALIAPAREIVQQIEPDVPPEFIAAEELLGRTLAERRFNLVMLGAFGATALLFALAGIYGAIAFDVAQRTNERRTDCARRTRPARRRVSVEEDARDRRGRRRGWARCGVRRCAARCVAPLRRLGVRPHGICGGGPGAVDCSRSRGMAARCARRARGPDDGVAAGVQRTSEAFRLLVTAAATMNSSPCRLAFPVFS